MQFVIAENFVSLLWIIHENKICGMAINSSSWNKTVRDEMLPAKPANEDNYVYINFIIVMSVIQNEMRQ